MCEIVLEIIRNSHFDENCMFLHREDTNEGILVDPGIGKDTILNYLEDNHYLVKHIIITHSHIDHIYSANEVRKKYNCDIYVSKLDEEAMKDEKKNESRTFYMPVQIYDCKTFEDREELNLCGIKLLCLYTPGHTKGSSCFYIEESKLLLSGDTIFKGGYGRTDLYGGSMISLRNSIYNVVFTLPDDTKVFPGHGEDTTIGEEKNNGNMI